MTYNFLPGTATLIEELDKKVLIVLRDGRTLIGYLRTIDQFANLVLEDTIERIHVGSQYGDIRRGIFVIRGESMVMLGEIDPDKEKLTTLTEVSVDQILEAQRKEQMEKELEEKAKNRARIERGLTVHVPDTEEMY